MKSRSARGLAAVRVRLTLSARKAPNLQDPTGHRPGRSGHRSPVAHRAPATSPPCSPEQARRHRHIQGPAERGHRRAPARRADGACAGRRCSIWSSTEGDHRDDQRRPDADADPGRSPHAQPCVRSDPQRESAGRQPLGLAAAVGAGMNCHARFLAVRRRVRRRRSASSSPGSSRGAAVYTAEQAAAGRAAYDATCAACHQPTSAAQRSAAARRRQLHEHVARPHDRASSSTCIAADDAAGEPGIAVSPATATTSSPTSCRPTAPRPARSASRPPPRRASATSPCGRRHRRPRRPRSRPPAAGEPPAARRPRRSPRGLTVDRRGDELRAGHRRDAAQPAIPATG